MLINNQRQNQLIIGLVLVLCLFLFGCAGYISYKSFLLLQSGGFNFVLGLIQLLLIGIPPLITLCRSTYQFLFSIPNYIFKDQLRVLRPNLLAEKELYNETDKWLLSQVEKLAKSANLPKPPIIAISPHPEANAYAVGTSKFHSLVVVTKGLLANLTPEQIAAILAHEIGHILNLDTAIKTLLNVIKENIRSIFLKPIKLIGYFPVAIFTIFPFLPVIFIVLVIFLGIHGEWQSALGLLAFFLQFGLLIIFPEIVLLIIDSIRFLHSRWREYHADAIAAQLTSVDAIVSALAALDRLPFLVARNSQTQDAKATLWIRMPLNSDNTTLFPWLYQSHPAIYKRIEALRAGKFTGGSIFR